MTGGVTGRGNDAVRLVVRALGDRQVLRLPFGVSLAGIIALTGFVRLYDLGLAPSSALVGTVVVTCAATVAMTVLFVLVRVLPGLPGAVLMVLAGVGLCRSVCGIWVSTALGAELDMAGPFVVTAGVVQTMVWGGVIAVLGHTVRVRRAAARRLDLRTAELRVRQSAADAAVAQHVRQLRELVDHTVVTDLRAVSARLHRIQTASTEPGGDELRTLAEQIQRFSGDIVRPLSHQLTSPDAPVTSPAYTNVSDIPNPAANRIGRPRVVRYRRLLGRALARPASPAVLALVTVLLLGMRVVTVFGWSAGILMLLVLATVAFFLFSGLRAIVGSPAVRAGQVAAALSQVAGTFLIGVVIATAVTGAYGALRAGEIWGYAFRGCAIALAALGGMWLLTKLPTRTGAVAAVFGLIAAGGIVVRVVIAELESRGLFDMIPTGIYLVLGVVATQAATELLIRSRAILSAARTAEHHAAITTDQALARERRASHVVSRMLHGDVQGVLTGASLALLMAGDSSTPPAIRGREAAGLAAVAIDQVTADWQTSAELAGSMSEPDTGAEVHAPLASRLWQLADQWRGIVLLRLTADQTDLRRIDDDAAVADAVFHTAAEAITNAVRHGHASRLDIVLRARPAIELCVSDDGTGPPARTQAGWGLTEVERQGGSWQLSPGASGGAVLRVRFGRTS